MNKKKKRDRKIEEMKGEIKLLLDMLQDCCKSARSLGELAFEIGSCHSSWLNWWMNIDEEEDKDE